MKSISRSLLVLAEDGPNSLDRQTRDMVKCRESSWRWFYDQYQHRLFRYQLKYFNGNSSAASDATQETLKRVVRYIKPFREEEAFWRWLCALAKSVAIDQVRKNARYQEKRDHFARCQANESAPCNMGKEPDVVLTALRNSLKKLSTPDQELLKAHYFEGISCRKIALENGKTEKSVENRLYRVRKKLRCILKKEMEDYRE